MKDISTKIKMTAYNTIIGSLLLYDMETLSTTKRVERLKNEEVYVMINQPNIVQKAMVKRLKCAGQG